jgi:hypothetical protein
MAFETFLALLLCLISIIAGVAPAKYPQYAGAATFIFWMAVVALVIVIAVMIRVSGVKRLAGLIEPTHIIVLGLLIAAGGVAWQMIQPAEQPSLAVASTTEAGPMPSAAGPAATPQNSVLRTSRFYSAKNKEEVAAFLDKISSTLNKPGEDIFLLALKALGAYAWNRQEAAPSYVSALDEIETKSAQIDAILYDDLLAHERDYRQEMNAILFPKDPLVKFRAAARDYRNGLAAWIALRDTVQDNGTRQQLQELVASSQRAFASARDEFLTWVGRRQELVGQTRRALRS